MSKRYLSEIYTLRFGLCGLSRAEAAAWLGVTPRTLQRHEHAHNPPQGPIYRALRLKAGYLEEIDLAWQGWRLVEGKLFGPGERYGFSAGQLMAIRFELQRLAQLERELRELRAGNGFPVEGPPLAGRGDRETLPVTPLPDASAMSRETSGQVIAIAPYLRQGNGG